MNDVSSTSMHLRSVSVENIRGILDKLGVKNGAQLKESIMLERAFLQAWAEFRDDFMWRNLGRVTKPNLTEHRGIVMKELSAGLCGIYLPDYGEELDKSGWSLADHYIRFTFVLVSWLRRPGKVFHARPAGDLLDIVEGVWSLLDMLADQYRWAQRISLARITQAQASVARDLGWERESCSTDGSSDTLPLQDNGLGASCEASSPDSTIYTPEGSVHGSPEETVYRLEEFESAHPSYDPEGAVIKTLLSGNNKNVEEPSSPRPMFQSEFPLRGWKFSP
ncbi:uncharacterized protein K452DRAFT_305384 [Aplosporella prunicola CBS 121167]|uniref:Uncharacterized protein n=1 Tax=Aplosporella prunicola CBS 121167 TaxID=1176127 RepID=A0A6A6BMQ3_9PEZI|nr:uncharacterized protein K452DRAFT_305384 [Aplosporella prunicola CBS 121167]KAF2145346.1 hypothetical protein K452DRAFT_305384 [Aplosporella prunicola CBS 121167]